MEGREQAAARLAEKLGVTVEEAQAALAAHGDDLLDAAEALAAARGEGPVVHRAVAGAALPPPADVPPSRALLRERERREGREAVRDFGAVLRSLLRHGMDNHLQVWRRGVCICTVPVLILILLSIVAFWITLPLVLVGLVCGCRYRFAGPDLDNTTVNDVMENLSRTVDGFKEEAKDEVKRRRKGD